MKESSITSPCWVSTSDEPANELNCPFECGRKHDEWKKPTWFSNWVTSDPQSCANRIFTRKINFNKYLG